jgi:hypothetical protein
MARCCQQVGVTHVILPATLARPSLLDRLVRRRVADVRDRLARVATVLVGPDEVLRDLQALGNAIGPKTVGVGGTGRALSCWVGQAGAGRGGSCGFR